MAGFKKLFSGFTFLLFLLVLCDVQSRYLKHIDLCHPWNRATEIHVSREANKTKIVSDFGTSRKSSGLNCGHLHLH